MGRLKTIPTLKLLQLIFFNMSCSSREDRGVVPTVAGSSSTTSVFRNILTRSMVLLWQNEGIDLMGYIT